MKVCDKCRRRDALREYSVPTINKFYTESNGKRLAEFSALGHRTIELCPPCATELAKLLDELI